MTERRRNNFVEKLFSGKDYWHFPVGKENFLETKEIKAWNKRFEKDRQRNFGFSLKIPIKCKAPDCQSPQREICKICQKVEKQRIEGLIEMKHFPAVFNRILSIEKTFNKTAQQFGLSLKGDNFGDWKLWERSGKKNFLIASLEFYGFSEMGEFNDKMKFRDAKGLVTELLKIYLDAHKDCCQW